MGFVEPGWWEKRGEDIEQQREYRMDSKDLDDRLNQLDEVKQAQLFYDFERRGLLP